MLIWVQRSHGLHYPTLPMGLLQWGSPKSSLSVCILGRFSHVWLFVIIRLLCTWNYPSNNTGGGSHFLLQGIFSTQGSNPHLLLCRWILYHLSHQGSLIQINLFTKQKQTHKLREWIYGYQREGLGEWIVRKFEIYMYTLLYFKWIINKELLYTTGNSAQYYITT